MFRFSRFSEGFLKLGMAGEHVSREHSRVRSALSKINDNKENMNLSFICFALFKFHTFQSFLSSVQVSAHHVAHKIFSS